VGVASSVLVVGGNTMGGKESFSFLEGEGGPDRETGDFCLYVGDMHTVDTSAPLPRGNRHTSYHSEASPFVDQTATLFTSNCAQTHT
jgi:hypothetical protein